MIYQIVNSSEREVKERKSELEHDNSYSEVHESDGEEQRSRAGPRTKRDLRHHSSSHTTAANRTYKHGEKLGPSQSLMPIRGNKSPSRSQNQKGFLRHNLHNKYLKINDFIIKTGATSGKPGKGKSKLALLNENYASIPKPTVYANS